jgi:hypothetical protein
MNRLKENDWLLNKGGGNTFARKRYFIKRDRYFWTRYPINDILATEKGFSSYSICPGCLR